MRKTGTCVILVVCVFCVLCALRAPCVVALAPEENRKRERRVRLYEILGAGPQGRKHLIPDSSAIISCRAGPGLARFLQICYCCRETGK